MRNLTTYPAIFASFFPFFPSFYIILPLDGGITDRHRQSSATDLDPAEEDGSEGDDDDEDEEDEGYKTTKTKGTVGTVVRGGNSSKLKQGSLVGKGGGGVGVVTKDLKEPVGNEDILKVGVTISLIKTTHPFNPR